MQSDLTMMASVCLLFLVVALLVERLAVPWLEQKLVAATRSRGEITIRGRAVLGQTVVLASLVVFAYTTAAGSIQHTQREQELAAFMVDAFNKVESAHRQLEATGAQGEDSGTFESLRSESVKIYTADSLFQFDHFHLRRQAGRDGSDFKTAIVVDLAAGGPDSTDALVAVATPSTSHDTDVLQKSLCVCTTTKAAVRLDNTGLTRINFVCSLPAGADSADLILIHRRCYSAPAAVAYHLPDSTGSADGGSTTMAFGEAVPLIIRTVYSPGTRTFAMAPEFSPSPSAIRSEAATLSPLVKAAIIKLGYYNTVLQRCGAFYNLPYPAGPIPLLAILERPGVRRDGYRRLERALSMESGE